jgi:hypothetical protein
MPASAFQPSDLPPAPANVSAATEHLSRLPKMSPTAGVGSQDYVAINAASVAALLLGIAAVLAIVNDTLGAICVAGLIVAVISLRQISHSNGTQTGRGIAMIGLFLCTSIGSYVGAADTLQMLGARADRQAIQQLCQQFGQDMRDRTYDAAYDLFSVRFKSKVSRQDFVARLKGMQDELDRQYKVGVGSGMVVGATWPGLASFNRESETGALTAQSEITLDYEHASGLDPIPALFRKSGENWFIELMPDVFPSAGH